MNGLTKHGFHNKVGLILFTIFSTLFCLLIGFHSEQIDRNYVYEQVKDNVKNDINLVVVGPNNHNQMLATKINTPVISDLFAPFSDSFFGYYAPLVHNDTNEEFTTFQYDAINDYMDGRLYRAYIHKDHRSFCDHYILNVSEDTRYRGVSATLFEGFIIVEDETPYFAEKDSRLTNLDNCRMPLNDNEVAITNFQADLLLNYGLKNPNVTFTSIDELIGQQIEDYTIVGIYNICDVDKYIDVYTNNKGNTAKEDFIFLYSFVKKIPSNWEEDTDLRYVFDLSLKPEQLSFLFAECKKPMHYDTHFINKDEQNDVGLYYNNNVQIYSSPLTNSHYVLEHSLKLYHLGSFYLNTLSLIILFVLSIVVVVKYPIFIYEEQEATLSKSFLFGIKHYGILLSMCLVLSISVLLIFTSLACLFIPMGGYLFTFRTLITCIITMIIHFVFVLGLYFFKDLHHYKITNANTNLVK